MCESSLDCSLPIFNRIDGFASQAGARCAVVAGEVSLSYRELSYFTNGIADHLSRTLKKTQSRVLVYLDRNQYIVLALLSIMKSGNVYIPVNHRTPQHRVAFILNDANVSCILTESKYKHLFDAYANDLQLICLDELNLDSLAKSELPAIKVSASDAAYIIYTSGSTGNPKGVVIAHEALTNQMLGWQVFTPAPPVLSGTLIASFGFDNSIWEHFFTLAWGGELHVIGDNTITSAARLAAYLSENEIVSTNIPPALLEGVVAEYESGRVAFKLKRLVAGGDSVAAGTYQRFKNLDDALELIVGYGPTEAAITATVYRYTSEANLHSANIPIGGPLPGYVIFLLDEEMTLIRRGEVGEIYIGGDAVLAKGYLNLPELSAAAFVDNPFCGKTGAKLYKTGDLARIDDSGSLIFLGRNDFQVKIRGKRIELSEVEANILTVSKAKNVVCMKVGNGNSAHLCAYLEDPAVSKENIRKALATRLEPHMIPSVFVFQNTFPINLNNKVDRKALPAPAYDDYLTTDFKAPQNALQQMMCATWKDVLSIPAVGLMDSFELLGGNSLQYVTMIAHISNQYDIALDKLDSVMRVNITVEELAMEIARFVNDEQLVQKF